MDTYYVCFTIPKDEAFIMPAALALGLELAGIKVISKITKPDKHVIQAYFLESDFSNLKLMEFIQMYYQNDDAISEYITVFKVIGDKAIGTGLTLQSIFRKLHLTTDTKPN